MLSRHFLKSFLALYATILVISALVIIIVEMMLNFDRLAAFQGGAWGVATYLFLRLPAYYLPYLVPATSFAAAFFCLGLPARAHEILAMKAGGISVQRIAVPILVAAAVLSALTLVLNETVVLDASKEFDQLSDYSESDVFQSHALFWYHKGDYLYNVRSADREARTLEGIRIFELGPKGRLERSISAEHASIDEEHRWHLHNAAIRTFDPNDPAAPPHTVSRPELVLEVSEERDLALLSADPGDLSLWRLREYIAALSEEGRDPTRYRAMFHARLVEPLSVLLFALFGIPIGLAVEYSRSLAVAGLQGIALVAIYYGSQTVAALFASGGIGPAAFTPWAVLLLFGAAAAWRFARVRR